mmetsp:Transcript_63728/g.150851  ORF Transcript_63728/g.150851 Transcript_63728/m.150851 type:complete len:224 (-) Transcript_63728:93-764(-)
MFVIAQLRDTIKILPQSLNKETIVQDRIEANYVNKVVHDVGFCISLHEIHSIGDAHVFPSDGSAFVHVEFSLVCFRPFIAEILIGTVTSCSKEEGLRVSLGFFKTCLIPPHFLRDNTVFDDEEKIFVWKTDWGDGDMRAGDAIRFRVNNVNFHDEVKSGPACYVTASDVEPPAGAAAAEAAAPTTQLPPMEILGSIKDDGLGLLLWWPDEGEGEEGEGEAMES